MVNKLDESEKSETQVAQFAAKILAYGPLNDQVVFYRKIAISSLALSVILVICLFLLMTTKTIEKKYFTVDPQGRITAVTPFDKPKLSRAGLGDWAADCIRSSYTFTFADYKQSLNKNLQRCFTTDGIVAFKKELIRVGTIKRVVNGQGALKTQIDGVALIKKEGVINGIKAYIIEMPVLVSEILPGKAPVVRKMTVIITAMRVDDIEYEKGMAIHIWNMEKRQ
ncbi:MAG: hypothetical protein HAW67_06915 [Endozoicomonadaceae bacterium]|nr:hypothetical protein [Endozoicomonadaceae bacterium]